MSLPTVAKMSHRAYCFRHGCDCFSEIAFYGEIKDPTRGKRISLSLSIGARGLQRLADACARIVDLGSDAEKLGKVRGRLHVRFSIRIPRRFGVRFAAKGVQAVIF
jgi:hypothetical protein